jgi:DNA-binding NarL/FixJ family response regulator
MKLLLVDDNRLLLEGLTNLLAAHNIDVTGLAYDGEQAITLARALRPDVILMDIRMPVCDGLCATRQIAKEMPDVKIVILTTSTEDQDLFEAVKSGACGYLLKSLDADELVDYLHQVENGIPPFSPGLAVKVLNEFARLEAQTANKAELSKVEQAYRLTPRQRQVLSFVSQGFSYKEVGQKMGLSPRTIKYHMAEIMHKLHLEHRSQVLAAAGRMDLDSVDHEQSG